MAGESRRCNSIPLHRAAESSSNDCTARGVKANSWPVLIPPIVNVVNNFWNDEETDLYLTDDLGENYELI